MSNWKKNSNQSDTKPNTLPAPNQPSVARVPWLLLVLMAAIAAIGANGWTRWVTAGAERDRLAVEIESLRHELDELRTNDLFDDLRIFSFESNPDETKKATLVWSQRSQKGVIEVLHLPPNRENESYELWIEDTESNLPVSGGTFVVGEGGKIRTPFYPGTVLKDPRSFRLKIGDQIIASTQDPGD